MEHVGQFWEKGGHSCHSGQIFQPPRMKGSQAKVFCFVGLINEVCAINSEIWHSGQKCRLPVTLCRVHPDASLQWASICEIMPYRVILPCLRRRALSCFGRFGLQTPRPLDLGVCSWRLGTLFRVFLGPRILTHTHLAKELHALPEAWLRLSIVRCQAGDTVGSFTVDRLLGRGAYGEANPIPSKAAIKTR